MGNAIESTNSQLMLFERQKTWVKAKRRSLIGNPGFPRRKKKRKRIGRAIKLKGRLIKQYKATLNIHMKNLTKTLIVVTTDNLVNSPLTLGNSPGLSRQA